MAKVTYTGEDIIIDNTELLGKRSDVDVASLKEDKSKLSEEGLGGVERGAKEEKKLRQDLKLRKWHEATHKLDVEHVCPVCGTHFKGRRNRVYCSPKCKEVGAKRKQRAIKREKRDFKPHIGVAGEVYFMATHKGKDVITFVPAPYAANRKDAEEYIRERYPENTEDYIEQVRGVLKK